VLIIRHFFFRIIIIPAGVVTVVSGATAMTVRLLVPIGVGTTLMRGAAAERLLQALLVQHRLLVGGGVTSLSVRLLERQQQLLLVGGAFFLTVRYLVPIVVGATLMRSAAVERLLLALQVLLIHDKHLLRALCCKSSFCISLQPCKSYCCCVADNCSCCTAIGAVLQIKLLYFVATVQVVLLLLCCS
jgi:hypothetical protein